MKQLEKLIPKYAMDVLKFDGYSLIQNNDKYVIVLEDKIITSSEESIFIAKWINNYLYKSFTNIKNYDLSPLSIEECIKFRECIIELEKISHDKSLEDSINCIENIILKKVKGINSEINKRISIIPYALYVLDNSIYDEAYPKLYPNKSNRPFVLYRQEDNGLLWMIPVSKAPKEKYEKVMNDGFKSIIKYSFVKTPSYILIQNIIPISYYHIRGRYLYNGVQVRITNKEICNTIGKQSKKIIAMITYDTYYFSSEIKYMYKKQLEYQKSKEQELELIENEDSNI